MDKSKVKTLIVIGNIVGVIAIIAIILLHNYNANPDTAENDESDTDVLKVSESAKSEPVMDSKKPIELRPTDSEQEDEEDKASEEEQEQDNETTDDNKTNDATDNNTEETEQTAVAEQNTNTEQDEQQYQKETEPSPSPSPDNPDKDKSESESSGETNESSEDKPAGDSDDESESQTDQSTSDNAVKECGDGQEKKNGECVDKEPTYVEKVRSGLPSGYSAGVENGKINLTYNGGTIAKITKESSNLGAIKFATSEERIREVDKSIGDLIYSK